MKTPININTTELVTDLEIYAFINCSLGSSTALNNVLPAKKSKSTHWRFNMSHSFCLG